MEKVVIVGENLGELDGRTLEVMKRVRPATLLHIS